MISPESVKPSGNHVLLLKCVNPEPDGVVLTDKSRANTNWCEVVAVGPDCEMFHGEHIGRLVWVPNWSHYLQTLAGTVGDAAAPTNEYWMCRETDHAGKPVIAPFVVID